MSGNSHVQIIIALLLVDLEKVKSVDLVQVEAITHERNRVFVGCIKCDSKLLPKDILYVQKLHGVKGCMLATKHTLYHSLNPTKLNVGS